MDTSCTVSHVNFVHGHDALCQRMACGCEDCAGFGTSVSDHLRHWEARWTDIARSQSPPGQGKAIYTQAAQIESITVYLLTCPSTSFHTINVNNKNMCVTPQCIHFPSNPTPTLTISCCATCRRTKARALVNASCQILLHECCVPLCVPPILSSC